ncbi:MAG TPA: PAS domain S-box protein [Candidatus Caccousia avicola]|uniref:histidine kinase n=1 Tax=Candidatus Caccousia avicola TaxID=2840721 RepID=A0A9D1DED7_9FIRM|nr:PAS domain S-box protein [Candidatus Caccousia avicola]
MEGCGLRKRVFSALLLAAGLSLVLFGALTALLLEVTGKQLLLMGVVLVVSATISTLFVRKIGLRLLGELKEPLKTAEKALDHIAAGEVYAVDWSKTEGEYLSLFQAIERLEGRIHSLTSERDKVNLILDCMDEGVVLLDEHTELLASNRAARKLFHMPEDAENTEITDYIRSRRLTEAINLLQRKKESVVLDMEHPRRKGRSLRFFLSPVTGQKYQGQQVGMSILISDVTELKRAEGIRSEFTANVSHELKTPLTSIKGFTDMLASGMVGSAEDQKRFLTMIGVEVDRLIDLINDILKLSELESVAIEQCEESSDVLNAANEVSAFLDPVAKKAGVAVSVSGEHVNAAIPLDRLKELLLNLMENGIKYNEPGGSVKASLETEEDFVRITVSDTGIGIPEESQSRVFERFYRVEKGRARKNGGTGLGLAIVKHIVVLYGGRMALQSELGKGSVFTVRLPRAS